MIRVIVFALMCVDSLIFAFSIRSFRRTIFRKDIFSNRYLVGAVTISMFLLLLAVYAPPLQKLLAVIFGISLVEIVLIEFSKKKVFFVRP